jgi:hypothetical protein
LEVIQNVVRGYLPDASGVNEYLLSVDAVDNRHPTLRLTEAFALSWVLAPPSRTIPQYSAFKFTHIQTVFQKAG